MCCVDEQNEAGFYVDEISGFVYRYRFIAIGRVNLVSADVLLEQNA